MKNVAIVGSGELSLYAWEYLIREYSEDINVKYYCDLLDESMIQDIEIINSCRINDLKQLYMSWEIDAVIIATRNAYHKLLMDFMSTSGIREVYITPEYSLNKLHNEYGKEALAKYYYPVDASKPYLEYYEFHVCDHCNLNCRGCSHIANAVEEKYADLEQYKSDLKEIKRLFSGVQAIKLLGGEPLLNNELSEFIEATRFEFPFASIYVGSNGLLIPNVDDNLLAVMKKNNIWFMVSSYPPTMRIKDRIIERCNEYGIYCKFTEEIDKFKVMLDDEKKNNRELAYQKCKKEIGKCFTLREGRISPCITFYANILNEKFGAKFDVIPEEDYFELAKETDGWALDKKLNSSIPFCEYCGMKNEIDWKAIPAREAKISDYVNLSRNEE